MNVNEVDPFHELIFIDEMNRNGAGGFSWGVMGGLGIGLPPILNFGSPFLKKTIGGPCLLGEKVRPSFIVSFSPPPFRSFASLSLSLKPDQMWPASPAPPPRRMMVVTTLSMVRRSGSLTAPMPVQSL